MEQYECLVCGWIYDEQKGDPEADVPPETLFENIPEEWKCPMCGSKKVVFTHLKKQ